jgi:DNA-directed RNA polymerase specialized sigma24 family protein/CheY-like chemotaxis protein
MGDFMGLSEVVVPELPYLRRYARAITGSQAMGDAAVRETLEALLAAPSAFDIAAPARTELYRIFHRLWKPATLSALARLGDVGELTPRMRHSLLLASVEGFSIAETSKILDLPVADVSAELEIARSLVANHLACDVLVIEDEAIIALHIQAIVKSLGHNVVGIARTSNEAVQMARDTSPELILADISLADGSSGIDAVNEILLQVDVPVIFVTAFPERLLTGERPEPTFLITKPFEPIMLTATIAQALLVHREQEQLRQAAA